MPSAGISATGTIYLTYQTINESADTSNYHQSHRHVYMMTSTDGGATWTYPFDIVPFSEPGGDGSFQEGVFASMARNVDATEAYVLYQRDFAPGHGLATAGTCDYNNNFGNSSDIVFAGIETLTLAVNDVNKNNVFVSQNYPNPSVGLTHINIVQKVSSDINISVTDMIGKTVYSEVKTNMPAGSHIVSLNTAQWHSGVYMYTVITNGVSTTRQMIVR
jgi:hypothetical protein